MSKIGGLQSQKIDKLIHVKETSLKIEKYSNKKNIYFLGLF